MTYHWMFVSSALHFFTRPSISSKMTKGGKRKTSDFDARTVVNVTAAAGATPQHASKHGTRVSISITVTNPSQRGNDTKNTSMPQFTTATTIYEDLALLLYLAEMSHRYLLYSIRNWALELLCIYISQLGFSEQVLGIFERVLFVAVLANHGGLYQAVVNKIYDVLVYAPPRTVDTDRIEKFVLQLHLDDLAPAISYRKLVDARVAKCLPNPLKRMRTELKRKCVEGEIGIEEGLEAMEALETLNRSFS